MSTGMAPAPRAVCRVIFWEHHVAVETHTIHTQNLDMNNIHTHQDEVRLIRRQHENRNVVVGQWCDDWFSDFGDSYGLWSGCVATSWHHVKGHPRGVGNADVLRLGQLWKWNQKQLGVELVQLFGCHKMKMLRFETDCFIEAATQMDGFNLYQQPLWNKKKTSWVSVVFICTHFFLFLICNVLTFA